MPRFLERPTVKAAARPFIVALGSAVARCFELTLRLTTRRVGIAVLYHSVASRQGDKSREIVAPHGVDVFERQIRFLQRRYRVVEARDLLHATRTRRRGQRFPVAITFDDDLACHAHVAAPVLERLGAPATFFLSGASLSGPFAFWWERLQRAFDAEPEPTLVGVSERGATIHEVGKEIEALPPSAREVVAQQLADIVGPDPPEAGIREADVQRLVNAGMTIGFHTLKHDRLPELDDVGLAAAMREGREALEAVAGYRLDVIAYPHGRADGRVAEAARAAGFTTGLTVTGAPVRPDSDPLLLGRITPTYRSIGHFALQLVLELVSRRR